MSKEVNFLDMVPVRLHDNYREVDGVVHLIFTHDKLVEKILRWMVKKGRTSTLELDKLGSNAWKAFDGKNTVYDIINLLLTVEEDSYESMEQRIIMFTRLLIKKKLIRLDEK